MSVSYTLRGCPFLTDACGWGNPIYYETIRTATIGHLFFVFGRGTSELHLSSFNTQTGVWNIHPGLSFFSDDGGWNQAKYYKTIQIAALDDQLFVFGRGTNELHLASFNIYTNSWTVHHSHAFLTDDGGWDDPKYYETIRVSVVGHQLFVIGRGAGELHLTSFNPQTNAWTVHHSHAFLTDDGGWDDPKYYSTIQVLAVGQHLYVFGRGTNELYLTSFNSQSGVWTVHHGFSFFTDAGGWADPKYHKTIQIAAVDQHLYVFGRGTNELQLASYDTHCGAWTTHRGLSLFTDSCGWNDPKYYLTIRFITVGHQLFVIGRGANELHLALFNPHSGAWTVHHGHVFLTDVGGWNDPKYYDTIRVGAIGDHLYVFGRGSEELHLATI